MFRRSHDRDASLFGILAAARTALRDGKDVMNRIVRYLMLAGAWTACIIGCIGVFVPVLPTTPLLLLAGERDTSTPIANVELVAETAPRASLHVVAGAAHQVPVARPVETANLIRSFITGNVASLVVSESSD